MKSVVPLLFAPVIVALATKRAPISPDTLSSQISLDYLLEGTQKLQEFAYSYPQRNRVFGGAAHNDTLNYIYNELLQTGAYDLHRQPQVHTWTTGNQSLTVNGDTIDALSMVHSPSTNVTAELAITPRLGCSPSDYDSSAVGKVLLTRRGGCSFASKSILAASANAAGLIIYNNVAGRLRGTLGNPNDPSSPFAPTIGISLLDGQRLLRSITPNATSSNTTTATPSLRLTLYIHTESAPRLTYNVIAQTKDGDPTNIIAVGSHTDSVDAGPGINDNGSGTISSLALARALALTTSNTSFPLRHAVRFLFFTAEEFGLRGSTYYLHSLSATDRAHIRLYLNFDMIASPNYAYMIYDGDGSSFNVSAPTGSGHIEKTFQGYFESQNVSYQAAEFIRRSDYRAFMRHGIPVGGLFTGSDKVKTQHEAEVFGGRMGVPYDPHYHGPGDTVGNLSPEAFLMNARAAAFAVASYARDLDGIPVRNVSRVVREGFGDKRGGGQGVVVAL
ncbi:transferrin receptor [Aspergillus homomorphus CBS 101889]|uniref:Peptide hydrolase n=1 Tax=Aspergillus homomorphus (strain CBS 101889) TaxID=1450537 RepID=A0A395HRR3_ASPHC|nr:transferrin receptor [Aspergillus homomorphus CBS 101889]RAL10189.1 transferrin receptor [Aspergillus homomorphus CBS 101889]